MLGLAEEIRDLINPNCEIIFQDLPSDDPKIRKPDTTRANTILNWEAKVNRKEGLDKTIKNFKERLGM